MGAGRTIHFTELQPAQPGSQAELEWNTYRQEVGRLLAEGLEGKFVLIKNSTILGIYDTQNEALTEGYRSYLHEPFLVHQIQTREPIIRIRG